MNKKKRFEHDIKNQRFPIYGFNIKYSHRLNSWTSPITEEDIAEEIEYFPMTQSLNILEWNKSETRVYHEVQTNLLETVACECCNQKLICRVEEKKIEFS